MTTLYNQIESEPLATLAEHAGVPPHGYTSTLPAHMLPGLARYVLLGIKPGSFLTAVLAEEWTIAEQKADDINQPMLSVYENALVYELPPECSGTPGAVRAWCERGGYLGRAAA